MKPWIAAAILAPLFSAHGNVATEITTEVQYANGTTVVQKGKGFVYGDVFVTVHHNIVGQSEIEIVHSQSFLEGEPIDATMVDRENDLALFDLPDALCETWCNHEVTSPVDNDVLVDQSITWSRSTAAAPTHSSPANSSATNLWSQARVLGPVLKGAPQHPGEPCADNLVIEVDAPFYPGSSGGPVLDDETGDIVSTLR